MVQFLKPNLHSKIYQRCLKGGRDSSFTLPDISLSLTWKILVTTVLCSVFMENLEGQHLGGLSFRKRKKKNKDQVVGLKCSVPLPVQKDVT